MEKFVEQTLLYDFYSELLNEHQRNIYKDVIFNDLSLSEIADEYGISRQGVHDVIKRVNHLLYVYENKLHLLEKFLTTKEKLCQIEQLTEKALYVDLSNVKNASNLENASNFKHANNASDSENTSNFKNANNLENIDIVRQIQVIVKEIIDSM